MKTNKEKYWGKGYKCPNCGFSSWSFVKEFELRLPMGLYKYRVIHVICNKCLCEDFKLCEENKEEILERLKENISKRYS